MTLLHDIDPSVLEAFYLVLLGLATLTILTVSPVVLAALFRGQR